MKRRPWKMSIPRGSRLTWLLLTAPLGILPGELARAEELGALTLERAIAIGLNGNPGLRLNELDVEGARIEVRRARSAFLPEVTGRVSASEQADGQSDAPDNLGQQVTGDLYQQQALTREAEQSLVTAQRNLNVSKLEVLRVLGRQSSDTFEIVQPDLTRPALNLPDQSLVEALPVALVAGLAIGGWYRP